MASTEAQLYEDEKEKKIYVSLYGMVWYGCEVMSLWNMKQKKKLCTGYIAYKNGNRKHQKKIAGSFHFNIFQHHHMNMKKKKMDNRKGRMKTARCYAKSVL